MAGQTRNGTNQRRARSNHSGRRQTPRTGRNSRNSAGAKEKRPRESLKVIAFDSVGIKKYAFQLQKAYNGNPCLRIVEGTPKDDGTFRKFDITVWSEDFESFFRALDEIRSHIRDNDIRTPKGHVWKPRRAVA